MLQFEGIEAHNRQNFAWIIREAHRIFSICRGQALAVALAGRRKAVPLPRIIEKILCLQLGYLAR